MRRLCALVFLAVLFTGCGATSGTSRSPGPTKTVSYPPIPAGRIDCGIIDELTGWPTTTVPAPVAFSCLSTALSAGQPARFVVIETSSVDSGRKTSDGYSLPARIVVTYRVLGPTRLQVTTDRREAGGQVTTKNCTGLAQAVFGSPPAPTGCTHG